MPSNDKPETPLPGHLDGPDILSPRPVVQARLRELEAMDQADPAVRSEIKRMKGYLLTATEEGGFARFRPPSGKPSD